MAVKALLLSVVTVIWLYFLWSRRKFYICALKMKGPWGYPFIGIIHKLYNLENFLYILPKSTKDFKLKTCFTWFALYPVVYTIDPDVAELVLQSPDCLYRGAAYSVIASAIGTGVLASNPPKWNKHRKLMNPCFGYKALLELAPTFNNFARDFCAEVDKCVGCGEVDIKELVLKIGLRISVATTIGSHVDEESYSEVLESFEVMIKSTMNRMVRPWLYNKTIYTWTNEYKPFKKAHTFICNFIQDIIRTKLQELEEPPTTDTDLEQDPKEKGSNSLIFMDHAVRTHLQNEFTIKHVIEEVTVVIMTSYETTAVATYSMLMLLAMHPEVQERLFEEISTLFQDEEFEVTYGDFKNLVYLELCIKEALRLTPSGPIFGRKNFKDLRISEDITIPAGVEIFIDVFNMHRDEDIWGPTAKAFNPDRFLPSNLDDKQKRAFMPFSKGKRNCLGWQYARMSLKVMLIQVLRKYKFSTSFRFEDLRYVENISLSYATTPLLEIHRR